MLAAVAWADPSASDLLVSDSECEQENCALNALQLQKVERTEDSTGEDQSVDFDKYGYHHWATTTMYGDAPRSACGGINTAQLVQGTHYYNVASAQAMWRNCGGTGNCWCGQSGGGGGTLGMGCFTCGKGRFLRTSYGTRGHPGLVQEETNESIHESIHEISNLTWSPFASKEITFIVGDLCPHAGNEDWCPRSPGQRNDYGSYHHLDFSHYPRHIDLSHGVPNLNFVFNIVECPHELRARQQRMSRCR